MRARKLERNFSPGSRSPGLLIILLVALLAVPPGCAVPEKRPVLARVTLSNKDIISGKLKDMVKKKLRIDHKFAGLVTIDWKGVVGIETDNASKIELKDGNILYGRFLKAQPAKVKIVSDSANSSDISIYDVASINAPEAEWQGKLTLKYSRLRGNTTTDDFGVRFRGSFEAKKYRVSLKGSYDYGKFEDEVITKESDVKLKYDYKISERWYGYGAGGAEYDRIAKLNMRSTIGAGIGMKAIDNEEGKLRFEAGSQYTNEDYENQVPDLDDHFSEGTFTVEFERKLTPDFKLYSLFEVCIPFKVYDDWRTHFEVSVSYLLSKMIAAEVGFIFDSDQGPPPGVERNDKEAYAGLSIEF